MKYEHHQGMLQHTFIHKQQEQKEITDFFLNPQASTLIKFLMPRCWLKLNTESKSNEHHLSPNRICLKDVKWNVKQVKYKKLKCYYRVQGLKFHQTHGRAGDAKPTGLTPLVTGDAKHEAAEDKLPPALSNQNITASLSASTNCSGKLKWSSL